MKKILYKIIFFTAILILVVLTIEYLLDRKKNNFELKKTYFEQKKSTVKTLILGDSHSLYGVIPHLLDQDAYNLSNVSQDLYYDYMLLKKYEKDLPRLKVLIMNLSYFSWFFDLGDSPGNYRTILYDKTYDIRPLKPEFSLERYSNIILYRRIYKPSNFFRFLILNRQIEPLISDDGFLGKDIQGNNKIINEASGKNVYSEHLTVMHLQHLKENIGYFSRIAEMCKSRKIKLLLFSTPTCSTYYKHLDPETEHLNSVITSLMCSRFGIEYLDFSKDASFSTEYFFDDDHLNIAGAEKFTALLKQQLVN